MSQQVLHFIGNGKTAMIVDGSGTVLATTTYRPKLILDTGDMALGQLGQPRYNLPHAHELDDELRNAVLERYGDINLDLEQLGSPKNARDRSKLWFLQQEKSAIEANVKEYAEMSELLHKYVSEENRLKTAVAAAKKQAQAEFDISLRRGTASDVPPTQNELQERYRAIVEKTIGKHVEALLRLELDAEVNYNKTGMSIQQLHGLISDAEKNLMYTPGKSFAYDPQNIKSKSFSDDTDAVTDTLAVKILGGVVIGATALGAAVYNSFQGDDNDSFPQPIIIDSDGDGYADTADACLTKGNQGYGVDANGCPKKLRDFIADTDGDFIANNQTVFDMKDSIQYKVAQDLIAKGMIYKEMDGKIIFAADPDPKSADADMDGIVDGKELLLSQNPSECSALGVECPTYGARDAIVIATDHGVKERPTPEHLQIVKEQLAKYGIKFQYKDLGTVDTYGPFDKPENVSWNDLANNIPSLDQALWHFYLTYGDRKMYDGLTSHLSIELSTGSNPTRDWAVAFYHELIHAFVDKLNPQSQSLCSPEEGGHAGGSGHSNDPNSTLYASPDCGDENVPLAKRFGSQNGDPYSLGNVKPELKAKPFQGFTHFTVRNTI